MKQAYATLEWRDGDTGDFKGWMRTGLVRPLARIQTKAGEYPRGGDPYQDERGRLASAPGGAAPTKPGGAEPTRFHKAVRGRADPKRAIAYASIAPLIAQNNRSGLSKELVLAVIYKESRFDPLVETADTNSTATGLMQVSHTVVDEVNRVNHTIYGYDELTNPATNIVIGSTYLKIALSRKHGNLERALDYYGTGAGYHKTIMMAVTALKGPAARNPVAILQACIGR